MHNFLVKTNYMLGMFQILILIYYKFDMVMPYIMYDNTHLCTPSRVQIHGVKKCDTCGMILKQLHQFVTLLSIICKTP